MKTIKVEDKKIRGLATSLASTRDAMDMWTERYINETDHFWDKVRKKYPEIKARQGSYDLKTHTIRLKSKKAEEKESE